MNMRRAFVAGVVGAVLMSILMGMGRMMGMTAMNLEMSLGSMMTHSLSNGAWLLGLMIHLTVGGLLAMGYAFGFEYITHRVTWLIGVGFAVIHVIIAGMFMGMIGSIHPLMSPPPPPPPPGHLLAPGVFGSNFGPLTVMAFIILHLVYGAIVGGIYKPAPAYRFGSASERNRNESPTHRRP